MENTYEILKELDLGTDLELITKDFEVFKDLKLTRYSGYEHMHPTDYYYQYRQKKARKECTK
tara:strand:+ start:407 stop:592 length:186 start_codon:yes stop_codon:yes gene_type:complete